MDRTLAAGPSRPTRFVDPNVFSTVAHAGRRRRASRPRSAPQVLSMWTGRSAWYRRVSSRRGPGRHDRRQAGDRHRRGDRDDGPADDRWIRRSRSACMSEDREHHQGRALERDRGAERHPERARAAAPPSPQAARAMVRATAASKRCVATTPRRRAASAPQPHRVAGGERLAAQTERSHRQDERAGEGSRHERLEQQDERVRVARGQRDREHGDGKKAGRVLDQEVPVRREGVRRRDRRRLVGAIGLGGREGLPPALGGAHVVALVRASERGLDVGEGAAQISVVGQVGAGGVDGAGPVPAHRASCWRAVKRSWRRPAAVETENHHQPEQPPGPARAHAAPT